MTFSYRSCSTYVNSPEYPIPDDTPLPFGHRKIMPDQGNGPSDHTAEPESRADAGAKLKIIRGIARSSYGVGPAA